MIRNYSQRAVRVLRALQDRWHKLSPNERFRYQIATAFLLVAVYGLILYPISHRRFEESKKMLNRRADRIKKRAGGDEKGDSGPNPQTVASQIEKADAQLKAIAAAFDELNTRFAPLESGRERRQLMLEISRLAERSGVQLLSVARKGASSGKEMTAAPLDPVLGRPLLVVTADARFGQLLTFLDGLRQLPFHVSVMNLKIYSDHRKGGVGGDARAPEGALYVALEVSI